MAAGPLEDRYEEIRGSWQQRSDAEKESMRLELMDMMTVTSNQLTASLKRHIDVLKLAIERYQDLELEQERELEVEQGYTTPGTAVGQAP